MNWKTLFLMLGIVVAAPVMAQNRATPLVSQAIDDAKVVRLRGSIHPLAQARYDRGAVSDSFPAERVLLLLNRPAERETALQTFLADVHQRGSDRYPPVADSGAVWPTLRSRGLRCANGGKLAEVTRLPSF
jgi:hypothetical protein